LLRNRVFWVFAPCGWVISSRCFGETYTASVARLESIHGHTALQRTFHGTTAGISRHYSGHVTALQRAFHGTTADISRRYSGHFTALQRTFHGATAGISRRYSGHFTALQRTFDSTTADISQPPSRKSRRFSVLNVLTPKITFYCTFYPIFPQFQNLHFATFTILAPKPSHLISVLCITCIQSSPPTAH
jgi:hypothetical protein